MKKGDALPWSHLTESILLFSLFSMVLFKACIIARFPKVCMTGSGGGTCGGS